MTPVVKSALSDSDREIGAQAALSDVLPWKRIEEALGARDQAWLSRESGIPTSTVSDLKLGKMPRADRAVRIARALGRSVEQLFAGSAPAGAGDEFSVEIEEIDLAYGLGGSFSDSPVQVETHRFPRAWLETITRSPASTLMIARGRGDSMQPTIQDGDMVMIDRSQRTPREQDAIWALTVGDIAMIKRLRSRGERVIILSDNDRVPLDDFHHEEINIVGRVIFIGRRV